MSKKKRPKKHPHPQPQEESRPPDLHAFFRRYREGILVALAALHVLLFLVFFLNMASRVPPDPLVTTPTQETKAAPDAGETALPGPGKTGSALYGLFSLVLWIAVAGLWRSGIRRRRERRFIMMMLTPGTVLVAYLIWKAYFSSSGA